MTTAGTERTDSRSVVDHVMGKDLLWRLGDQYAGVPLDPAECDPDPITEFRIGPGPMSFLSGFQG